jgi:hypothetical protein
MYRLFLSLSVAAGVAAATGSAAAGDYAAVEKPPRLELSAGPNWLFGPPGAGNYGAGISFTPHPVLSVGFTLDRPGRGTTAFAHFKLAPLASVLRVSPYAIGGLGRQWYEELGADLRPVTVSGRAGFLGAGIDFAITRRIIVFGEARLTGLANSGSDGDPVGGAKLGIRLGF